MPGLVFFEPIGLNRWVIPGIKKHPVLTILFFITI